MNIELAPWPIVIVPAAVIALAVRVDAKLLGPYFALSELIPGFGNDLMVSDKMTRAAMIRRLAYPFLIGAGISVFGVSGLSLAAVGFLGAALLLWPIIFHGLPYGISKRSKMVWGLYLSLLISYGGLSLLGGYVIELMREAGEGNIGKYVSENFRDWIITAVVVTIFTAWGRGARNALNRQSRKGPREWDEAG
ncbi:hypothetical protein D477_001334 [Arthrobacter crystallopoietes BAB-32]|uniref:Uncharacterized protein n=1 Tax=Arthrobacter crystallopoietes BAB-32 TaxID=1246476 RepID=N1V7M4_9MICC|nr:hypothetical protein [Arthrobacter crystallopoietes]EMY36009.1 hypothetical protein D477_001334 [Arthrobacter crystallopoietes BAB-32]